MSFLPFFIVFSFCLTPLVWFWGRGAVLINGVDTNFPLDPDIWFLRRFFVWSASGNAGNDFSSSTAGLFFHFIQYVPYKLGLSLQQVEIFSLIFWFSAIILTSFYLSRVLFPKKFLVQILFVSLYAFNIYLFNTWENVKVANISLMAAIPLAVSILLQTREKKFDFMYLVSASAVTGVLLSGSGINPAYFISFFIVVGIFLLGDFLANFNRSHLYERLKNSLIMSCVILLVNIYWIIPTTHFIFSNVTASGSINQIGFTDWTDSLSMNTSILNVLRLQGAWDWYPIDGQTNLPLYIPYALNYFHSFPFIVFSFLLPLLSLISLVRIKKSSKHLYIALGIMLVLGVFLGAGTHSPTGSLFHLLSNNLPFFTLFRSPWYIFTPLLILAVSGLTSLLFNNLLQKRGEGKFIHQVFISVFILMLVVANLIYSYPLTTGKIFRPERLDSFFVKFPNYIFDSQAWLNNYQTGRAIEYPDHEMQNYEWGYRGIESILQLLTDKETLFLPINNPESPVSILIRDLYFSLKKGEIDKVRAIAGKLNISTIFEKKDQKIIAQELPQAIKELPTQNFGQWNFYQFPNESFLPKITSISKLIFVYPYHVKKSAISVLSPEETAIDPQDSVIREITDIDKLTGKVIFAENSQVKDIQQLGYGLSPRLTSPDLSKVIFNIDVPSTGSYQPVMETYKLADFGIDIISGLEVEIDGRKIIWEKNQETQSYIYFSPIELSKGKHIVILRLANKNLVADGDFETGDSSKKGGKGRGEGIYEINKDDQGKYLSITNTGSLDVVAILKAHAFDPMEEYYIETKYKQVYGGSARIVASQFLGDRLVNLRVENLPKYSEWRKFSFYYKPEKINSDLYLELIVPAVKDPFGTKIFYDDVKINKLFLNDLLFVNKSTQKQLATPTVNFRKISPSQYEAEVTNAISPHIINFAENYSKDWILSAYDLNGKSISITSKHFTANYFANSWYLGDTPQSYKIKIFYQPQNLFNWGLAISGMTLILVVILNVWIISKRKVKEVVSEQK